MTKKASKETQKRKPKASKLRLNKKTIKDLDANDSSQVKGAAIRTGHYTCYVRHCE